MAGEHILVIDDSETHRELMVLTLETLGYWVNIECCWIWRWKGSTDLRCASV